MDAGRQKHHFYFHAVGVFALRLDVYSAGRRSDGKLPLPTGYGASMSVDGQSIACEPILRAFGMWKDYRGAATSRIWLGRISDSSVTPVPRTNSNDFNPMWAGDRVYFISDRNGPATL
jgi:tricorn protease